MPQELTPDALLARFKEAGAEVVSPDILQPAETLLDLYGEDIRGRAFVTHDPLQGEMMLRPDFTVPVVQQHMKSGAEPARYAYAGPVFRRQEQADRPREYMQVGFELFARDDTAKADAEVFALFHDLLQNQRLTAITGDIGLLIAAVDALSLSASRKAALRRHIWRPRRFRTLLEAFTRSQGQAPQIAPSDAPEIGKRQRAEIEARLALLAQDTHETPLSTGEAELIHALLTLKTTCADALNVLQDMAVDLPALTSVVDQFAARLTALAGLGINVDDLRFEGSFGLTHMEYYDGFVFGFSAETRPDLPPVASGGRYDALTDVLGQGRTIPAIGGVIRPALLEALL